MDEFKVYVKTDKSGRVVAINSSAFIRSLDGWTQIDAGTSHRHHHAQGNYFPKPLMDDRDVYRYKLVGGKIVERTEEEMAADVAEDIPAPPPAGGTVVVQPDPETEARLATVEQSIEMLLEGVTGDE